MRWADSEGGRTPVFGVCLGHQAIAEVYGGVVDRAEELLHGRTSQVHHDGAGVFAGLPDPFTGTRYHSLAVVDGTVPDALEVTARTDGGVIMGLRHRELAIEGVQFHPESVLTQGGHRMLANWLERCGDAAAAGLRRRPRVRRRTAPAQRGLTRRAAVDTARSDAALRTVPHRRPNPPDPYDLSDPGTHGSAASYQGLRGHTGWTEPVRREAVSRSGAVTRRRPSRASRTPSGCRCRARR